MKRLKLHGGWLIAAILFALVAGIYGFVQVRNEQERLKVNYEQVRVQRGDIVLKILATGVVQPKNRLEIKPPIAGRVEKILVNEGQEVRRGQVLAWMSSSERAAMLDVARAKGPEELAKWEDYYRPTPILAPINGQIILRKVEAGQTFSSSDAILVMADELSVKAQVDETDLALIRLGQSAEITLDAYPNEPLEGKVTQIAFEAKTVNNVTTYEIDVVPIAKPKYVRSGMTANVEFIAEEKTGILQVPVSVLRYDNGETQVLVLDKETSEPAVTNVKLGITDGRVAEILAGLNEDQIVLLPQVNSVTKNENGSPFQMRRRKKEK